MKTRKEHACFLNLIGQRTPRFYRNVKMVVSLLCLLNIILIFQFSIPQHTPLPQKTINYLQALSYDARPTLLIPEGNALLGYVDEFEVCVYYSYYDENSVQIKGVSYLYQGEYYIFNYEHIHLKILYLTESDLMEYLNTLTRAHMLLAMESVGILKTKEDV